MHDKKRKQRAVRFSSARFKRLPMEEKLAYLRAAFSALNDGVHFVDVTDRVRKAAAQIVVASKPSRPLVPPRVLSKDEFGRLTIEQKLEYLSRVHRDLEEAARKSGRATTSGEPEKKRAVPVT